MVRPHLAAIAIMAAPNCTAEPREKWMSEDAMKAKIATLGYEGSKRSKFREAATKYTATPTTGGKPKSTPTPSLATG